MNWLAHALLSTDDVEFRLGNLLADLVKGRDREGRSAAFLRGTACHQAIDTFTDSHPVVHRSRARIDTEWGHLTGILSDIFYDHFLALDWDRYCDRPLAQFTAEFYAQLQGHAQGWPEEAMRSLERLVTLDVLGSYRTHEGIIGALRRVSQRLTERIGRPFDLEPALSEMTRNFTGLEQDFAEFFPQLQDHVRRWMETHPASDPHGS